MNPLLSVKQLAEALQLSEEQVRRLTRAGQLPHHRIGGVVRYDFDEVKAATRERAGRRFKIECPHCSSERLNLRDAKCDEGSKVSVKVYCFACDLFSHVTVEQNGAAVEVSGASL